MKLFYYACPPIDFFAGALTVSRFKEVVDFQSEDGLHPDTFDAHVRAAEAKMGNKGITWVTPMYVTMIPNPDNNDFDYCFIRKEEANGMTHVVSKVPLGHLEDYNVDAPMKPATETVADKWDIDEDLLQDRSHESDYFERSYEFYIDVKAKPASQMTTSQKAWLDKLEMIE